jgi:hypothetical protein
MAAMRRLACFAGTFGCAFSFVLVCLSGCLAPAASAHACCDGASEGWRAPTTDCCSVVPGVSNDGAAVGTPAAAAQVAVPLPGPLGRSVPAAGLVSAAPSPPLVLRI